MFIRYFYEDKRCNDNCKIVVKNIDSIEEGKILISKLNPCKLFGDSAEVYDDKMVGYISFFDIFGKDFKVK